MTCAGRKACHSGADEICQPVRFVGVAHSNETADGILSSNVKNTSGLARLGFVAASAFQHHAAGTFGICIGMCGRDQQCSQ